MLLRMAEEEIVYEWQRVAAVIEARIDGGDPPPGGMLRGERDLAEELGVSLWTVRRAIRDLRERGIVVTLPQKGTFVRRRGRAQNGHTGSITNPPQPS